MHTSNVVCFVPRTMASACFLLLTAAQVMIASAPCAHAARIVMYPFPWASRAFDLVALGAELAYVRGHQVVIITPRGFDDRIDDILSRAASAKDSGGARSDWPTMR